MGKVYIEVCAVFDKAGKVTPIWLKWTNGKKFEIDKVTDIRKSASLKAGGTGIRYTIKIGEQTRYLFCECQNAWNEHNLCRWFLETND
ncbi:MAG: hypothetical protein IJZ29_03465 [Clostridia bacterium]|nr:hypothetical protein [Clostridia bacterium]